MITSITILATLVCVTLVGLQAFAELQRMIDERNSPLRRLKIPTRRPHPESLVSTV